MATPRGRAVATVVTALVIALMAAACTPSGQRYVKNSSDGVYFKIPDDWELYDEDAILEFREGDLSPGELDSLRETGWQVFFDAAPRPTLEHSAELLTDHPNGQARVLELDADERDIVSMQALRNLVFPLDDLIEVDPSLVEIIDAKEINQDGAHGVQFVYNIDSQVPALISGGELDPGKRRFVTFNQAALLDDANRKLYSLVISCEVSCYDENKGTIDDVVESWTVKDR